MTAIVALTACDPALSWNGQIVTPAGEPIAGARVSPSCRSHVTTTSDRDGRFRLWVMGGLSRRCELVVELGSQQWRAPIEASCRGWFGSACTKAAPRVVVTPVDAIDSIRPGR